MKTTLIFILGFILIGSAAFTQKRVDSFFEVMTTRPSDKKVHVIDIDDTKKQSNLFQTRTVTFKKPNSKGRNYYKLIGKPIDEANIIDYVTDTLYIVDTYSLQRIGAGSTIVKTQKGRFIISENPNGTYTLIPKEDDQEVYLNYQPWEIECREKSDELFNRAVFKWNLDLLEQLIRATGQIFDGEHMTVTRIIIRDYQVLKKETISQFGVPMYWALDYSGNCL